MTEAFFTVVQTSYTQAQINRLGQEFLCQIAGCKVPEMSTILEGIRNGKKHGLLSAVAVQCESRDTGHIDGAAAAQHGIQNVVLRTKNAAGLNIDGDLAVRQLFYFGLEISSHLANDGIKRVNLCIYQSYFRHIGSVVCTSLSCFGLTLSCLGLFLGCLGLFLGCLGCCCGSLLSRLRTAAYQRTCYHCCAKYCAYNSFFHFLFPPLDLFNVQTRYLYNKLILRK